MNSTSPAPAGRTARRRRLHGRGHDLHARQAGDVGARRGIDREDLAQPAQRLGQHAGRMAGADLDDVLRLALAHQGVGHGGVERGEPRLVEQAAHALERGGVAVDGVEHRRRTCVGLAVEQRLDRRIGRLRAGRRQQRRVAMRDEPAARRQAKHGRQAERQPPPASAQAEAHQDAIAHGASVRPSCATITRGRPLGGGAGTRRRRLARDVVHEGVVMAGIVMEDGERADAARRRRSARPPARSNGPSPCSGGIPRRCSSNRRSSRRRRGTARRSSCRARPAMLGVGDVADRLAAILDAIAGGAVGMVERRGAHRDRRRRRSASPALNSLNSTCGLEDVERHRIDRRLHQVAHDLLSV